MSIQECFQVANLFLKEGIRPYCEDWSHIDIVARHDDTHATENPSPSPLGIDFLGHHNILFADDFAISEIRYRQKQAPILNAKG